MFRRSPSSAPPPSDTVRYITILSLRSRRGHPSRPVCARACVCVRVCARVCVWVWTARTRYECERARPRRKRKRSWRSARTRVSGGGRAECAHTPRDRPSRVGVAPDAYAGMAFTPRSCARAGRERAWWMCCEYDAASARITRVQKNNVKKKIKKHQIVFDRFENERHVIAFNRLYPVSNPWGGGRG